MGSRCPVLLFLTAALLASQGARAASISANFGISVAAAPKIAAITLSNNTFAGGAPSGTVVGSIGVTMSPVSPGFSGVLSLDGPNAASFQIVGSNLVTNGTDLTGTYGVNIVATQSGATGSPFIAPETITGTSSTSVCIGQTYTYNLVSNFGAVSGGPVATNNAALQAFNIEAQRRTRPAEPGYAGGANGAGNAYAGASKDNCIVLNIPAGTYQYSWNRFGQNIARLKIVGAGSDLTTSNPTNMQNTNNDGYYIDETAFQNHDYFGDCCGAATGLGYFINTAPAGNTSVTLTGSPSNASNFYVGRWVLIASYDQQPVNSYPPNFRYFDFAKVTSINPTTGVITLDTPLQFAHLSTRPYVGTLTDGPNGTIGPARIIPIDTPAKPVGIYHEYDGLHVLGNPNWTLGQTGPGAQSFQDCWRADGLIDGSINDIHGDEGACFSGLRNFVISNSKWQGDESDKIVSSLTFLNDRASLGSTSHAGELLWHVIGGSYGPSWFQGLRAVIEGGVLIDYSDMPCNGFQFGGFWLDPYSEFQTIAVTLNGVTFKGANCANNPPLSGPYSNFNTVTIDGTAVRAVSGPNGPGTRLQVQRNLGNTESPSYNIDVGWSDGASIMKNGTWVTGAKLTSITGDPNNIYVDVTGTTFVTGDVVWTAATQELTVENSLGQSTGYSWSSPNLRYPNGPSIPVVIWSNNSGS